MSISQSPLELLACSLLQAPFATLLFLPDDQFTIVWRNQAHAKLSATIGENIAGQGMFEAFPPSPDEKGAAAKRAIEAAVDDLRAGGPAVNIGPYRYDLQEEGDEFVEHWWQISMSPVWDEDVLAGVLQVAQDVTQSVLEANLTQTFQRAAEATASVSYFQYDPLTDRFERSAAVDAMFGFAPGEAGEFAGPFFARVHPDDLPGVVAEVDRVFAADQGALAAFDYRVPQSDGTEKFIRIRGEVVTNPSDRTKALVGTFLDLTEFETTKRALQEEVAQKEALVSEANHRIKNSLAIATSMMRIEHRALDSEHTKKDVVEVLQRLESRLDAISKTHGLMRLGTDNIAVELSALLEDIVKQTRRSTGLSEAELQLRLAGLNGRIDSDTATNLALILNELMTNALKFGIDDSGVADVLTEAIQTEHTVTISVTNNIASSSALEGISSTNLGAKIVASLAQRIGATIDKRVSDTKYTAIITMDVRVS